jgi:hypothetical protein
MAALPQFLHHPGMGYTLFTGRCLSLGRSEFFEEIDPGVQFFVVLDAHDDQVAFAVRGQVYRLIPFMADGSDFPGFISQA